MSVTSIRSFAAALALLALTSVSGRAAEHTCAIANVVLVHGAWADGSSWSSVIAILQADGFHTTAVQIPLTSFDDDVAATQRAIANQNGPVLLVGHSYGGAVITEAGNDPKVAGLMYVAAFAPDQGQSALGAAASFPTPGIGELRLDQFGYLTLTSTGMREDFAQDLPAVEQTVLTSTQGPTGIASLEGIISSAAWHAKPSWYVVAKHDRMLDPQLERMFADAMGAATLEVSSSHVVMMSHPFEVAAFIRRAACRQ
jgi:pimeloyl-ACP methyl ester carboxylesterase